ncbi:MAG TPA: hypothetical protein VD963_08380 [Phycisphaerales bacterium]|nr:hypothetical protein [Phycisphaerales bacterium]
MNRPGAPWLAPLAIVLVLPLAGCESKVTRANYDQIDIGMPMWQVEKLLGSGKEDSSGGGVSISGAGVGSVGASPERVFVWEEGAAKIVVHFVADKVVQKRSEGL